MRVDARQARCEVATTSPIGPVPASVGMPHVLRLSWMSVGLLASGRSPSVRALHRALWPGNPDANKLTDDNQPVADLRVRHRVLLGWWARWVSERTSTNCLCALMVMCLGHVIGRHAVHALASNPAPFESTNHSVGGGGSSATTWHVA